MAGQQKKTYNWIPEPINSYNIILARVLHTILILCTRSPLRHRKQLLNNVFFLLSTRIYLRD